MLHTKQTDRIKIRKERKEGTLTEDEWIELLNKHDSFDQYAKRRKEKQRERGRRVAEG